MASHHILLVANRTCPRRDVLDYVAARAAQHPGHRVHVLAPALNSRLRHICSDVDQAIGAARARLDDAARYLRAAGVNVDGHVGDSDPFVAVGDTFADFAADEVIVSTLPPGESNWLERNLIERLRERYGLPVTHVVSRYESEQLLAA
jgi:hypothetical protein